MLLIGREGQVARSLLEKARKRHDLELVPAGRPMLDLADPGSASSLIYASQPDLVINAAAYTAVDQAEDEPELAFRINAEGAREVAAAAFATGAPVIQLSTDYVFDGESPGPYTEDTPTNPLSVYGRSKLAGEEKVRAANPNHLILRTAWVYSPFGRNFVKSIMAAAGDRAVLDVVDDQQGSPTCALDLADGILSVIDRWRVGNPKGLGQVYHLAGSGTTSWSGLAEQVMTTCRGLGLPAARINPISTEQWPTKAARPRNSTLDHAKFARDFDFKMPDWRQSVAMVVTRLASGEG